MRGAANLSDAGGSTPTGGGFSVGPVGPIKDWADETGGGISPAIRAGSATSGTGLGGEIVTTRAEELSRLWEWSENIREEVGALSDAIAKLAAKDLPEEGDDEEAIT